MIPITIPIMAPMDKLSMMENLQTWSLSYFDTHVTVEGSLLNDWQHVSGQVEHSETVIWRGNGAQINGLNAHCIYWFENGPPLK